jgi:hypothetical protein
VKTSTKQPPQHVANCDFQNPQLERVPMVPPTDEVAEREVAQFDEQELGKHLQRVAQSAQFMRAETLRRLLLYLWAHREEDQRICGRYRRFGTPDRFRSEDGCLSPGTDLSPSPQAQGFLRNRGRADEAYMLHTPMGTHSPTILSGASEPLSPAILTLEETPFSVTRPVACRRDNVTADAAGRIGIFPLDRLSVR